MSHQGVPFWPTYLTQSPRFQQSSSIPETPASLQTKWPPAGYPFPSPLWILSKPLQVKPILSLFSLALTLLGYPTATLLPGNYGGIEFLHPLHHPESTYMVQSSSPGGKAVGQEPLLVKWNQDRGTKAASGTHCQSVAVLDNQNS